MLKAARKQVAEISRKGNCFFQTAQKFWFTDERWLPIIALKCQKGVLATFTAAHMGILVSSNTLRVPLCFLFWGCQKHFNTVKGTKFPFEVSQYKNANFKHQFSHCLPWDHLRRTTDILKTVVSQISFGIFKAMYHSCSLMHVWKIRESLHRNRPVLRIFQNRICSKVSPQVPPAISPRVLQKTLAETCPQPVLWNRGSSVPTLRMSSSDWAQTKTRQAR